MREIKFRGMNAAGEMVYGDLIQTKPNKVDGKYTSWIKPRCFLGLGAETTPTRSFIKVDSETVGQYTGRKDADGIDIFEGDIVSDHVAIGQVKYSEQNCAFRTCYEDGRAKWFYDYILNGEMESIVVIGNIHKNPELLINKQEA